MPDLLKQIIGGIISAIVIAVYLFAFFSITGELKGQDPETDKIIENTEESVKTGIRWYHIVGGISSIVGIFAGVLWILDYFGIDLRGEIQGSL